MDQFFQTLRKIQKKERNNSSLARVDDDFYEKIYEYLAQLRKSAIDDPFSEESNLLKDTQRIATEICERREHKISDAAVLNIHRSYHLFTGKPQFDLVDTTPLNLTTEEEKFYFSLIGALKDHRLNISLDKITNNENVDDVNQTISKPVRKPEKNIKKFIKPSDEKTPKKENAEPPKKPKTEVKKEQSNEKDIAAIYKNVNEQFVDFEPKNMLKDQDNETILIFEELNQIIAVDEKVYGPFRPQDLVVLPKINAKTFIKNRKARTVKL